ncbi:MAG: hypothetical protein EBZ89_03675, partial [Chloroflexi bacterium]|nr:hypothetical protein [Chloroflexota bacterium]
MAIGAVASTEPAHGALKVTAESAFGSAFLGLVAASSLMIGAALGIYVRAPKRVVAAIMAFGAGALIESLAIELAFGGAEALIAEEKLPPLVGWLWVAGGFVVGGSVYSAATIALDNAGAAVRKASSLRKFVRRARREKATTMLIQLSSSDLFRSLPASDLVRLIRTNVRIPDRAMGDLRAQITALKTGERGFLALLERYGRAPVLSAISNIMQQSERAARARTRSIPDGVYEAEAFMDDDSVDLGKPIPIKVRVIKQGDSMTVDLSDISPQVRGGFNSGATTGHGCAQVAYKCLTSPTDYPINEGSFRALKVKLGEATVVSAVKPAAMRVWMSFPMTVVDAIFKAMEQAIPERTIAAHHADLMVAQYNGISPRDGRFYIGEFGPSGGGWGAKHNEDGVSAT